MVKSLFQDWSDWTGWTEDQIQGSVSFSNDSDPLAFAQPGSTSTEEVAIYKATTWIAAGDDIDIYARIRHNTKGSSADYYAGIYVKDSSGNSYSMFISGNDLLLKRGRRTGNRGVNVNSDLASLASSYTATASPFFWLKMSITSAGVITFFKNTSTTALRPDTWTEIGSAYTPAAPAFDAPAVEVGCGVYVNNGESWSINLDDLHLVAGDGNPIDNSVVDGTTVKIAKTYASNSLGQLGSNAKMIYHDPTLALGATVEAAHRTVATISETRFNKRFFQGEITGTNPITKQIILKGMEEKLRNTIAAYDPVLGQGVVENITGNVMYKQDVGPNVGKVFGAWADKLIVFVKSRPKEYRCNPTALTIEDSGGTPVVPDAETGGIPQIFALIPPEEADSDNGWNVNHNLNFYSVMQFDAWIKNDSTINKALLKLTIRVGSPNAFAGTDAIPALQIYDDNGTSWGDMSGNDGTARFRANSDGNDDFGIEQTVRIQYEIDISKQGTLLNYFNVGSVNNAGFKKHILKIRVYSGGSGSTAKPIHVEYAELFFDLDIDQVNTIGMAKITSKTDHSLTFYASSGVSWMNEDIRDDGISGGGVDDGGLAIGDKYFITDKLSDIATAIWSNSNIDTYMNLSFNNSDEIADVTDYSNVHILDIMQKWSELIGAAFWIDYTNDPTNDLPTFNFATSFVSTGLTLTDADIFDWEDNSSIRINSENEKSTLKVEGKGISGTTSITPEHTAELGLEGTVVTRPDITTAAQMTQFLSKKKFLYTNANRFVTFKLNYDFAVQNYFLLGVGKTVGVKFPSDGSIANYIGGQQGVLLIYQMELNRNVANGYNNFVTIIAQKRTVS